MPRLPAIPAQQDLLEWQPPAPVRRFDDIQVRAATPNGLMSERAYRGLSPVITHSTDGRISSVLRAGLTNVPNLTLTSLHNQGPSMDLNRLREALGLPATADEAAILAAAAAARDAVSTHNAALSRIPTAVGIAADAKPDVIITSLQSQRAAAGSVDTMARDMVALQTQLHALTSAQARKDAVAMIDGAMRDGKPIPAALREHFITRHMADAASVETELAAMVSLHSSGVPPRILQGDKQVAGLNGVDANIAAMMGVDTAKMAATRAARLKQGAA